eukprot:1185500-Prorocentrum_minimum.AAC.1
MRRDPRGIQGMPRLSVDPSLLNAQRVTYTPPATPTKPSPGGKDGSRRGSRPAAMANFAEDPGRGGSMEGSGTVEAVERGSPRRGAVQRTQGGGAPWGAVAQWKQRGSPRGAVHAEDPGRGRSTEGAEEEAAANEKAEEEAAAAANKKAKKKAKEKAAAKKKAAEEVATNKKAEEEAAAKKKAEEEAAAIIAKKKADEEAAAIAKKKAEERAVAEKTAEWRIERLKALSARQGAQR